MPHGRLMFKDSDLDTIEGLAVGHTVENAPAQTGSLIGPLFQSFMSNMASFKEIVRRRFKLFSACSLPPSMDCPHILNGCELQADGSYNSERSISFHQGQSENGNKEDEVDQQTNLSPGVEENSKTAYFRKLSFDMELSTHSSEQALECAITQNEENSSMLLQSSVHLSASHDSTVKTCDVVEEQKCKPSGRVKAGRRKPTGSRSDSKKVPPKTREVNMKESEPEPSDEQLPHMTSVKSNQADSCDGDKTLSLRSSVRRQQSKGEEGEEEDTSSSRLDSEDAGLREEKSLSDSEIKVNVTLNNLKGIINHVYMFSNESLLLFVLQKQEERGKVSSFPIRKTLPKLQNNLTPMGLPKPIRYVL